MNVPSPTEMKPGAALYAGQDAPAICLLDGCPAKPKTRGLCHRHYQAMWKAGRLDEFVPQPRSRKPGLICPPEHAHADTTVCYIQHKCRCDACREHRSEVELLRRRQVAFGRWDTGLVDADPAREHVELLGEFGIGYKRVARLADVSVTVVRNLVYGRQDAGPRKGEHVKRVKRETAERILAVKPDLDALAPSASVPALGTRRRLQALVTLGWSPQRIAPRVGLSPTNMTRVMTCDRVSVATHRAVAAAYDELWNIAPPRAAWHDAAAYSRARRLARERRWLPPLAWDDPDTDAEPPVVPDRVEPTDGDEPVLDEVAIELACAGEQVRLSKPERLEAVRRLHALRCSDRRIAQLLHRTDRTVLRDRQELGLPAHDLATIREKATA
ncbi:hypothetical protein [Microbacterium sp. G2-8]|uniref:hypothetical protein n=1 Tax=Microbacterium sp. G2-8 TaxID=2842454 RepID=UPI001C8A7349|nr:hypothetical protein [Microbacterium sp. G2-8]